jgi:RAD51-like protein 1
MANKRLERIKHLAQAQVEALASVGILTSRDLLTANVFALCGQVDTLGYDDIMHIRLKVCESIAPKSISALGLLHKKRPPSAANSDVTTVVSDSYLPSGLTSLDAAMHGGLAVGTITEIVGPPGIGKSQFCMNVCVQLLLRNISRYPQSFPNSTDESEAADIIYIDTELKFDPVRLIQVFESYLATTQVATQTHADIVSAMKRIKVIINECLRRHTNSGSNRY